MKRLTLALVLAFGAPAFADVLPAPGTCAERENDGCSCGSTQVCSPALTLASPAFADALGCGGDDTTGAVGPDMSVTVPRDMAPPPHDLQPPRDARRDRRTRRRSAGAGRGLILSSGVSALALFALRRRYKTSRPTPAESALAASATRSDS